MEIEKYFIKAKDKKNNIQKGLLIKAFESDFFDNLFIDTCKDNESYIEIKKETICKNMGFKDTNGNYIYEYDLLEINDTLQGKKYRYIIYDDFYKKYVFKSFDGGISEIKKCNIIVKGNIKLNDKDYTFFKNQCEKECSIYKDDKSYCYKSKERF